MKRALILIILLTFSVGFSATKVMTFNTMCDFCKGSNFWDYHNRQTALSKIIKSYKPDLIALQEVRSISQVKKILSSMPEYKYICTDSWLMSYADPVIIYHQEKYKLIDEGQGWLGPNPKELNFGWKWALPRQFIWVKLKRKVDGKTFIFISSHFDNRVENLDGAAILLNKTFKQKKIPLIFAADTNLTVDLPSYAKLIDKLFINSFDLTEILSPERSKNTRDFCYLKKGKNFPACRVDHILLSKNDHWQVKSYHIDQTKNYKGLFPSDHRPVIIELDF